MRARSAGAFLILAALLAPACGKKGPILPPLVLRPQPAESVRATQRGGGILLEWTNPTAAVDGSSLAGLAEVEVWLEVRPDPPPAKGFPGQFMDRARRIAAVVPEPGAATGSFIYAFDPRGWRDRVFVFALRVRESMKKRLSDFSDEALVRIQPVPLPPSRVRARVYEDRIELSWSVPAANFDGSTPALVEGYTVRRSEAGGPWKVLSAVPVHGTSFADPDFDFGRTYRYLVRSVVGQGEKMLESDDAEIAEVTPKDTFPPSVPSGVSIAAGADFLTLVWDANAEKDLAGYHVWRRAEESGDFVRLTSEPIVETTFTDRAVEKNRVYAYSVSAADTAGNVSARSAAVTAIIKDQRP
jgi:hypothetical protein